MKNNFVLQLYYKHNTSHETIRDPYLDEVHAIDDAFECLDKCNFLAIVERRQRNGKFSLNELRLSFLFLRLRDKQ